MTQDGPKSLWNALTTSIPAPESFVSSGDAGVARGDLSRGSILGGRGEELRGRSVVVMTTDQLSTALALFELDGIARRIVVCPNETTAGSLPYVVETAEAEAVVSDLADMPAGIERIRHFVPGGHGVLARGYDRSAPLRTEWITFTSGTMGRPKLVVHTLSSLIGAIPVGQAPAKRVVWGTLYDIRRFGGMQVFLRATLSGASLVLSGPAEPVGSYLERSGRLGITHISGTPSQWRRALMSGAADRIEPEYVRLSGEIADQGILNQLRAFYPKARMGHAFGSSEAGTVIEVTDGIAGIPASMIGRGPKVETKVEEGTLRVRSGMTAIRYLGKNAPAVKGADGFVDTGDIMELREGRYFFAGRRDGRINVGGLKVYPEEVEGVVNLHPQVHLSRVGAKKNAVTGAVVTADVVLRAAVQGEGRDEQAVKDEILELCHKLLPAYKAPAVIRIVSSLAIAESGKLKRGGGSSPDPSI